MKRLIVSAVLAILLTGCGPSERTEVGLETWCDTEEAPALERMILACAKAANPMSDEEGEDLVAQCEKTAQRTVCPKRLIKTYYRCDLLGACWPKTKIPYNYTETYEEKR